MAYIYGKPDELKYKLDYSDNSGERLSVSIFNKWQDVNIKQSNDLILVPVDDLDWLIEVLHDIKRLAEERKIELPNPERSIATKAT